MEFIIKEELIMIKPLSIGILIKGYKKIKIFQNEKK